MIIWALIGLLVASLSFLPNRVVNTNCGYIYSSSILIIVGSLIGMTGRPIIALSLVVFGCLLMVNKSIILKKRKQCKVI